MSILNKAQKNDLIALCQKCGINIPDNVTVPSIIEVVKYWESYNEKFIKDRFQVISWGNMWKFEIKKLTMQVKINTLKDVGITVLRTETGRHFHLLKLLNYYGRRWYLYVFSIIRKASLSNENIQERIDIIFIKIITVKKSSHNHKRKITGNK